MKKKLTIITVCYNAEKTIERTIESVYKQKFDNYEYLFIDGKSKDNTLEVIKSYAIKFSEKGIDYKYISEKDCGLYDAMNKGSRLAKGEWIIFMNADDEFVDNECLSKTFSQDTLNYDVIYGDSIVVKNKQEYYEKSKNIESITNHLPFIPQSAFIKRNVQLKYLFDLQYKISADYDCFLRMYIDKVKFLKKDYAISKFYFGGVSNQNTWCTYKEDIDIKHKYEIINKNSFSQYIKYIRRYILSKVKR